MLGKSSKCEQSAGDGKVMEGLEDDRSSLDTEQGGCTDSPGTCRKMMDEFPGQTSPAVLHLSWRPPSE
jgi:hypothetical protein